ncbi:hypothetical protein GCM10010319_29610 [Streptomyces blastmyceticus]|uniref:Uncharacterized protein n=1 Tax=Streptomyces blastmyceticus TaxID=68180 RepID=A0ABN0WZ13_9ACTN
MLACAGLLPGDGPGTGPLQGREGVHVERRSRDQCEPDGNALVTVEDGQDVEKPVQSSCRTNGNEHCPAVRLSGCPAVRLSGCPAVRLSGCPAVRLSGCPEIVDSI